MFKLFIFINYCTRSVTGPCKHIPRIPISNTEYRTQQQQQNVLSDHEQSLYVIVELKLQALPVFDFNFRHCNGGLKPNFRLNSAICDYKKKTILLGVS